MSDPIRPGLSPLARVLAEAQALNQTRQARPAATAAQPTSFEAALRTTGAATPAAAIPSARPAETVEPPALNRPGRLLDIRV